MNSSHLTNGDNNNDIELEEEFKKLALLVPTIPRNECLTELEFLEFVIAYIQQLQELLSHDQWNQCLHHLTTSIKNSFVLPSSSSSSSSSNTTILRKTEKCFQRNPLSTLNLDTNIPHNS